MTCNVRQLLAVSDVGFLRRLLETSLSPVAQFRLIRLSRALLADTALALDARNKLFTPDNSSEIEGRPGVRQIRDECLVDYQRQMSAVCDVEVEVVLDLIPITDLAGVKCTAAELDSIAPFLDTISS